MASTGGPQQNELKMLFGKRVRALRTERGWSQEELADRAGLDRTYVSSLERGHRNVALLNIVRLAEGLEVDPGSLLAGFQSTPG